MLEILFYILVGLIVFIFIMRMLGFRTVEEIERELKYTNRKSNDKELYFSDVKKNNDNPIYKQVSLADFGIKNKIKKDEKLELSFNLDIHNEKTKKQAEKDIDKLEELHRIASSDSEDTIYDAINQLQDAIDDYEHNKNNSKDNFEGWFYDETYDDFPVKKRLHLVYKDGKGQITYRDISTSRYGKTEYGGFILAYCEMRKGNRSFRTDRILECYDIDTGELIKDVGSYLTNLYHESDDYKQLLEKIDKQEQKDKAQAYQDSLLQKYSTFIKVLVYLLRCDGTYNAKEKAIVKELFEGLENSNEFLTDKLLHDMIKNYSIPSENTFKRNVTKLIENNEHNIDILELANNIISTQKTIHPNEKTALEYIEKKLL